MPASNLDGLVVLRIVGDMGGKPGRAQNRLICRTGAAAPNTAAGMAGLAAAAVAWYTTAATRALIPTGQQFEYAEVQDLSPTGLSTVRNSSTVAGTKVSSQDAADLDALVVTLNTGLQGRAFRGRWYAWGAAAADLSASGNSWDGAYASAWETAVEALFSAIATAVPTNYVAGAWHQNGYGGPPPIGVDTFTPFQNATGRTGLATQRRRGR